MQCKQERNSSSSVKCPVNVCVTFGLLQGMSCEADLEELLHQIDIMVSHRRQEWAGQNQELQTRLQARETQLIHSRMQVRDLQREAEESERVRRETARGFEHRLGSLHSELEKLRDSYGRLQDHHRREEIRAAQEKDTSFESDSLSRKLEELQTKSREWEKQTYLHQKDLAALQVNRKLLAAKCQLFQLQSERYQGPLAGDRRGETQKEVTEVQARLEEAQEVAQVKGVTAGQLREALASRRDARVEKENFLSGVCTLQQESQDEVDKLRAELQARDDLLQATQLEGKRWKREADRLREQLSAQEIATRLERESKERIMGKELRDLREKAESLQRQLETSIQQEELLRADIIQLQIGLESSNAQAKQLKYALDEKEEMLRDLEHAGKHKDNEIVTLKEQLVQREATRAESLHLRAQLTDSESTVASANHRAAQLQRELQSITGKATEYQVAKIQLEALRLENKKLKQLISEMESNTSSVLGPLGNLPAGNVICDVSSDSGQWEGEWQLGETGCSMEDPCSAIRHVSPQPASWEQTEATGYPPAQSPTPKPQDRYYPHGNREEDLTAKVDRVAPLEPSLLKSPREQFLQEEEQRMRRLERHFDSYIQELHSATQRTLLKYGIGHPGDGGSS
ncbi:hypothetical protein SKAU_G00079810 [Synaphobranchus kaupii]|uniref:Centrosomal protein of 63 kDa n=1 Tax=Synaphobranchus kaupii TaxID=118154 RepID=A0A9Q1J5H6_SYNKA|nr:hypothetical protein SKAU_G00079810 [Synaphobranchus kaupii]